MFRRLTVLGGLGLGFWLAFGCEGSGSSGPNTEEVLQMCVRLNGCLGEASSLGGTCDGFVGAQRSTYSNSTEGKLLTPAIKCLESARTCAQVKACVEASSSEKAACTGLGDTELCVGSHRVECPSDPLGLAISQNCAAAGLVCGSNGKEADCGEKKCNPEIDKPYCQGDLFFECKKSSWVFKAKDCRNSLDLHCFSASGGEFYCIAYGGGTCGNKKDGQPSCIGDGATCDSADFSTRCEGSVVVSCIEGKEARLDCEKYRKDLTCGKGTASGKLGCTLKSTECAQDDDETCTSGAVSFCYLGKKTTLTCSAYGFSGCSTAKDSDQTIAFCVP